MLLELARIKIKENEKVKEFNQRFITHLNKIPGKPPEAILIEYYIVALPLTVAMFVKRKEVRTLEENFEEAIQIEKDLASFLLIEIMMKVKPPPRKNKGRRTRS